LANLNQLTKQNTFANSLYGDQDSQTLYSNNYQDVVDTSKFFNREYDYNTPAIGSLNPGGFSQVPQAKERGPIVGGVMGVSNFAGNLLGGFLDSAAFGIPGMIDDLTGLRDVSPWLSVREWTSLSAYDPWQEETASGRMGRALGTGLGMLNPFKLMGKGLTMLSRGAQAKWGWTARTMNAQARRGFQARYLKVEGVDELVNSINRVGGAQTGAIGGVGQETFKKGFNILFQDAYKLLNTKTYRDIMKGSQTLMAQGVEELAGHICKLSPRLGQTQRKNLARMLLDEANFQSANSFNRMSEAMFTKIPGLKNNTYAVQTLGAFTSDLVQGFSMFAAQNLISAGGTALGTAVTGKSKEDLLKNADPRGALALHQSNGFVDSLKTLSTSAVFMGLMGPTRFVKGGATYGGQELDGAVKDGLKTIIKAWRNVKGMTGEQARFHIKSIDIASDGLLHRNYSSLIGEAGNGIASLSDDAAKSILVTMRKDFTKRYRQFITKEFLSDINVLADISSLRAGKGLQSSVPRMIAGTIAMNSEGLYRMFQQNPGEWYRAFGETGDEIASNIIMGMVFSKQGRSFHAAHRGKLLGPKEQPRESGWLEMGDPRRYYASNLNDIHKMKAGLEIMGMDTKEMGFDLPNSVYESQRGFMKGQGIFREIFDLTEVFYVDRVNNNTKGLMPADVAYMQFLKDNGIVLGKNKDTDAAYNVAMEQFDRFKKVMDFFDNSVPEINKMFRTTSPEEM
jgi:hypothetical protein